MTVPHEPAAPARGVDAYAMPVRDAVLIYAPLHGLTALVNRGAAEQIRSRLALGGPVSPLLAPIVEPLESQPASMPHARDGPLDDPLFLGLITTRGCHLGCRYCDFGASADRAAMPLEVARDAIDAYLALLASGGRSEAEIHFFGGEPFDAEAVVHFAVEYATMQAVRLGLAVRFEATTSGAFGAVAGEWIADHVDTVVLSLDGPPDIHDGQRPTVRGTASSGAVLRSARILSAGSCELILRACVTRESVDRLEEIAGWMSREFTPSTVCFEALIETARSRSAGLEPPDPWQFGRAFLRASRILEDAGIEAVLGTADMGAPRISPCPVGRDALIVSPDGAVDSCYLPREAWRGLDLRLGIVDGAGFDLDPAALRRVRGLNVLESPMCTGCLLRYHCAGGCRVRHDTTRPPGSYDTLCIQTRVVAIGRLIERAAGRASADEWLADSASVEAAVWQASDRLCQDGGAP